MKILTATAGYGRPPRSVLRKIGDKMLDLVADSEAGAIVERRLDVIKLR